MKTIGTIIGEELDKKGTGYCYTLKEQKTAKEYYFFNT